MLGVSDTPLETLQFASFFLNGPGDDPKSFPCSYTNLSTGCEVCTEVALDLSNNRFSAARALWNGMINTL